MFQSRLFPGCAEEEEEVKAFSLIDDRVRHSYQRGKQIKVINHGNRPRESLRQVGSKNNVVPVFGTRASRRRKSVARSGKRARQNFATAVTPAGDDNDGEEEDGTQAWRSGVEIAATSLPRLWRPRTDGPQQVSDEQTSPQTSAVCRQAPGEKKSANRIKMTPIQRPKRRPLPLWCQTLLISQLLVPASTFFWPPQQVALAPPEHFERNSPNLVQLNIFLPVDGDANSTQWDGSQKRAGVGVLVGLEEAWKRRLLRSDLLFNVTFRDTRCDIGHAGKELIDSLNFGCDIFVGPSCEYALGKHFFRVRKESESIDPN